MKYRINTTEEKVSEGEQMIQQNGGSVYESGRFSISGVEGRYSFSDGVLTINVTDKPFLATWGMIESKINQFFK